MFGMGRREFISLLCMCCAKVGARRCTVGTPEPVKPFSYVGKADLCERNQFGGCKNPDRRPARWRIHMNTTYAEPVSAEAAAYGGLVDAVGGIATIILAIVALSGVRPDIMVPITVIVFGAALLIQGGTMLSEYAQIMFPRGGTAAASPEQFGGSSISVMFLVGAAGIVLGVLALVGIAANPLMSVALIVFGSALLLSSNAVRALYQLQASRAGTPRTGSEMLAGEMASGSAGVQILAGLSAIVLGILAVTGTNPAVLVPSAFIVLGATVVLTGSALSGLVMGFMRTAATAATTTQQQRPTAP